MAGTTSGDLNADGSPEVVVTVRCADGSIQVLVNALVSGAVVLLGDAAAPEPNSELRAVVVRDGALLVTTVPAGTARAPSRTAVTARWVVQATALVRTDRWEDPLSAVQGD